MMRIWISWYLGSLSTWAFQVCDEVVYFWLQGLQHLVHHHFWVHKPLSFLA